MTVRRALQWLRVLFLGICAVCAATVYVWHSHPDFVQRVDRWFVRRHTHLADRELSRARDLVAADRSDDAIRVLEALVPTVRDARRGNRLEPVRIAALALLSHQLARRGDVERALLFADEIRAHDDRDLLNEVWRVELLERLGRDEERLAALEAAFRVGSRNPTIARAYLRGLANAESADAALRVVLDKADRLLPGLPAGVWESTVQPDGADSIRSKIRPDLGTSGDLRWVVPVVPEPAGVVHVRLDIPSTSTIRLEDVGVVLHTVGGQEVVLGLEHLIRSPFLERDGDALVYGGGDDPFFILKVPETMRGEIVREVEFRLRVQPVLAAELRTLLLRAKALQDRDALVADYGEDAVVALERALR